ncbi:MAG: CYTH domain-containing protein, partial [bacterium]
MTSNNKEIEIQVEIQNSKKLLKFLTSEAKYIATKNQLDEYFTPKDNNFVLVRPVKEWLRLRDAEGKYSINYKCWHFKKDGTSSYCDEYETKLEDIDKMRKIFKSLGYKSLVKVRKIRKIWV